MTATTQLVEVLLRNGLHPNRWAIVHPLLCAPSVARLLRKYPVGLIYILRKEGAGGAGGSDQLQMEGARLGRRVWHLYLGTYVFNAGIS